MTSMLPAYKPIQPVQGLVLVSGRNDFLAPKVHSPLHAPVTPNNAKALLFWDGHSLPGAHASFKISSRSPNAHTGCPHELFV